jgi:mannose-6-phosphate isomerase-like protein (cupin superfamily)
MARRKCILNSMEPSAAAPGFLPALIEAGKGVAFTMLGTSMRLIATGAETGGRYTVLEQVTPAGWGPPRHIHSREDEIFYILEGTYEVHCGDERRTFSAGACAILPRGVPHGFRNTGLAPARLISVIAPSGLEDYFIAISKFAPMPPSPADLAKLAGSYGLTLLPPGH